MKTLPQILGLAGNKKAAPLLLQTEIKWNRSVIHASIQASARAINEALGIENDALLEEFMQTQAGKDWQAGFRAYATHVLAKSL